MEVPTRNELYFLYLTLNKQIHYKLKANAVFEILLKEQRKTKHTCSSLAARTFLSTAAWMALILATVAVEDGRWS